MDGKLPEYPLFLSHLHAWTAQTLPDLTSLCILSKLLERHMRDNIILDHLSHFALISICSTVGFLSGQICHLCTAGCYRPLASMAGFRLGYMCSILWLEKSIWFCTTWTSHRKVEGHKYKSLCTQMDYGIPHLEDSIRLCEWCTIPPLTSLFCCAPGISWSLAVYLLHQRYHLNLTVRWHPFIVCRWHAPLLSY